MIKSVLELVLLISRWIEEGLRREDILKRLNDPQGVAQSLLERAIRRHADGAEYLGRGGKR